MSLETWKAEFYPEDADVAAEKGAIEATKHSLLKWEGLRKENKDLHGITGGRLLIDQGCSYFSVDASSCALCHFVDLREESCETCPFYLANGFDCSGELDQEYENEALDEYDDLPYYIYTEKEDPEPMIKFLENTLAYLEEKNAA